MAHSPATDAGVTPAAAGVLPENGAVGLAGGPPPLPGRDPGPPAGWFVSEMTTSRLRARRAADRARAT